MTKRQRADAIKQWATQKPLRDAARRSRGLVYPVPFNQQEAYFKKIKEVERELKGSPSPAMPVVAIPNASASTSGAKGGCKAQSSHGHREKNSESLHCAEQYYAMVHKQLSPKEWKQIDAAVKAVNAEWDQLDSINAWDYKSVCSHADKCRDAARLSETIHFGRVSIMPHQTL